MYWAGGGARTRLRLAAGFVSCTGAGAGEAGVGGVGAGDAGAASSAGGGRLAAFDSDRLALTA